MLKKCKAEIEVVLKTSYGIKILQKQAQRISSLYFDGIPVNYRILETAKRWFFERLKFENKKLQRFKMFYPIDGCKYGSMWLFIVKEEFLNKWWREIPQPSVLWPQWKEGDAEITMVYKC